MTWQRHGGCSPLPWYGPDARAALELCLNPLENRSAVSQSLSLMCPQSVSPGRVWCKDDRGGGGGAGNHASGGGGEWTPGMVTWHFTPGVTHSVQFLKNDLKNWIFHLIFSVSPHLHCVLRSMISSLALNFNFVPRKVSSFDVLKIFWHRTSVKQTCSSWN